MIKLFYTIVVFSAFSCFNSNTQEIERAPNEQSAFDISKYDYQKIGKRCRDLYLNYSTHNSVATLNLILSQLRDSLFVCWYGTQWDFYGTTEIPRKGKIACGYFVTTVLRDIGIKLNRIKLAQCASEEMIKKICLQNSIKRSSNEDIRSFVRKITKAGIGLYIVGLDFHTGFILNDGKTVNFIHANYANEKVVISEQANESGVLASSKYKVIGKIL